MSRSIGTGCRALLSLLLLPLAAAELPSQLRADQGAGLLEASFKEPGPGREAALRDSVVALARSQVGRRYRYGGESPERGFDCSGLVRYISRTLDVRLPRTAAEQARMGAPIARDTSELLPGDLVTFGNGRVSHIGIYVGNNRFIHASPTAGRVVESPLIRPPVRRMPPWQGVRRLFAEEGDRRAGSG